MFFFNKKHLIKTLSKTFISVSINQMKCAVFYKSAFPQINFEKNINYSLNFLIRQNLKMAAGPYGIDWNKVVEISQQFQQVNQTSWIPAARDNSEFIFLVRHVLVNIIIYF